MKAIISILLSGLFCAASAWGQGEVVEQEMRSGEIWSGCWEVSFLGHRSAGRFCWLSDSGRELRLEIGREIVPDAPFREDAGLPRQEFLLPLFQRTGPGWTAVLGNGHTGILQAWGREWEVLEPALGVWIRTLLGSLVRLGLPLGHCELPEDVRLLTPGKGKPTPARGWARACPGPAPSAGLRLELPEFKVEPDAESVDPMSSRGFRRNMTTRGRGRGGDGEIVNILVQQDEAGARGPLAHVTSSRKPGKLDLAFRPGLPVVFYYPEIFMPLWPLADLVEVTP